MEGFRVGHLSRVARIRAWSSPRSRRCRVRRRDASPILATRPRARTETQLETIRAFLAERDERFADLPRREALDLCRRAREESFEEGDVVRAVGEDDDIVSARAGRRRL